MFVIILNFETQAIDCLDLVNMPDDADASNFIEEKLDYSLSNCEWMVVTERPEVINYLN